MSTQYGFFIDSARCTGCKTCELACKDYKNLTPEVSFRRIYEYAGGDWQEDNGVWQQNVFAYYLSIACNHCEDPACTKVCPSGAMHKREDGFVVVNEEVCIGCRYCHMACPYGAPQYNADKGHMTKCDGCHERVAEGKKPICVESCPLRALDFGPIAELRAKHGQLAAVAPLPSAHFTRPSIVIKPNANARPCGDTSAVYGAGSVRGRRDHRQRSWLAGAGGPTGSPASAGAQYVFYLAADGHWFSCFGDASRFTAARV